MKSFLLTRFYIYLEVYEVFIFNCFFGLVSKFYSL